MGRALVYGCRLSACVLSAVPWVPRYLPALGPSPLSPLDDRKLSPSALWHLITDSVTVAGARFGTGSTARVVCISGLAAEAKIARTAGFSVVTGAGDRDRTAALVATAAAQRSWYVSSTGDEGVPDEIGDAGSFVGLGLAHTWLGGPDRKRHSWGRGHHRGGGRRNSDWLRICSSAPR